MNDMIQTDETALTVIPATALPTILAAIVLAMSDAHTGNAEEANAIGKAIVTAIAKGEVPHVSVNY